MAFGPWTGNGPRPRPESACGPWSRADDAATSSSPLPGALSLHRKHRPESDGRGTLYWTEDRSNDFCLKMAGHAGARRGDVLAFGHTHLPWHREVDGIHFVNTGSVGRPKDWDRRAGYVVLDLQPTPRPEFVRTEYDLDRAARGIEESTLPPAFATYLRTGGRSL